MSDKKEKKQDKVKKFRFNVIDALIVIVLVVVVFVGINILSLEPTTVEAETRIATAVVELTHVEQSFIDSMNIGDEVYLTVDNTDQVKIVDITNVQPHEYLGFDETTNTYKYTSSPSTKYQAHVTIEAEVREDDANIYAGSTGLKVGKGVFIKGKGYSSKGYILELETRAKGE